MRKWQILLIPIVVFFLVLGIGILLVNPIKINKTNNENISEDISEDIGIMVENEIETESEIEEFIPEDEYANYSINNNINFDNKEIIVSETIDNKEYQLNSLINEDDTSLLELVNENNGFSIYTLKDKVYVYTSTTSSGQTINSWAYINKDDDYNDVTTVDDYFDISIIESNLKNSKDIKYKETILENDITYDVLSTNVIKNDNQLENLKIDITEKDVTNSEDLEDSQEDNDESNENNEYIEYLLYINRENQQIEKIEYSTNEYIASIEILDNEEIQLPESSNIAEEISLQDFEWLLLGVKMAMQ
jgi:hypothetical protein